MLNNPANLTDPSGHRSCTAQQAKTGDETCWQNIWIEYKQEKQKELDKHTGYSDVQSAPRQIFAPDIPDYGTVGPTSDEELWEFIQAGDRAVRNFIEYDLDAGCSCNTFVSAVYHADLDKNGNMEYNEYLLSFRPIVYGEQPDIVLFVGSVQNYLYPNHAALVVSYDREKPDESIILQTNAGFPSYGIYYTKVNTNEYFHLPLVKQIFLIFSVRDDVR